VRITIRVKDLRIFWKIIEIENLKTRKQPRKLTKKKEVIIVKSYGKVE
jgi:hypothetical protein